MAAKPRSRRKAIKATPALPLPPPILPFHTTSRLTPGRHYQTSSRRPRHSIYRGCVAPPPPSLVPTSVMKRLRVGGEGAVDSINMAHALVLLARGGGSTTFSVEEADQGTQQQPHPGRVFECKTCSRRFPSFQALGGHRASHKKPRLAAADLQEGPAQQQARRPRVHECSVCGLEFAIGQALGGHMRRHRAASSTAVPFHHHHPPAGKEEAAAGEKVDLLCLDLNLNLSPSENDVDFGTRSLGLGLPMVDCFH